MKRVLCILSNMNAGGAETFLMKIYRQLDKNMYQMDFCINVKEPCFYEEEILQKGGKIYRIPSKSEGLRVFADNLYNVVKLNNYKYILRITSNAAGFFDLKIAKKAGAKVCCARSSNSSDGGSWKAVLIHRISRFLFDKYLDVRIAPSELAAIYTFGKRKKVNILHNAIDLETYHYKAEGRMKVRKECGFIDSDIVVGHVGRFMAQKNHSFLLDVFYYLHKENPKYKLLLIGKGELEETLKKKINDLKLNNAVVFAGVRNDIPDVMSAMDIFVFPSLYEGMPNTVIEAQATGLPCVIADTITREADITGLVDYVSLGNVGQWIECVEKAICNKRLDTREQFYEHQYDIASQTKAFTRYVFGE